MIALYDHIQQLRAELANNADTAEIEVIQAELAAALVEQAKLHAEFAAALAVETSQ